MYFVYASPTLQQSYDIYVGPGTSDAELKVTPIFVDLNGYKIGTADDPSFIKPANPTNQYYDGKSLLRLKVDLTGQDSAFKDSKPKFCNPRSVLGSGLLLSQRRRQAAGVTRSLEGAQVILAMLMSRKALYVWCDGPS